MINSWGNLWQLMSLHEWPQIRVSILRSTRFGSCIFVVLKDAPDGKPVHAGALHRHLVYAMFLHVTAHSVKLSCSAYRTNPPYCLNRSMALESLFHDHGMIVRWSQNNRRNQEAWWEGLGMDEQSHYSNHGTVRQEVKHLPFRCRGKCLSRLALHRRDH